MYFQAEHPAPLTACRFVKQNGMNTFTAFAGSTLLHYKPSYITVYFAVCAAGRYARQMRVWRLSIGTGICLRGVAYSQMLLKSNTACFHVHYSISSFEFLTFPTASSKTLKSNTFASFPYVDCCRSPLSLQIFRDVTALGPHSPPCLNFSTKFSHLTACFLLFFDWKHSFLHWRKFGHRKDAILRSLCVVNFLFWITRGYFFLPPNQPAHEHLKPTLTGDPES